MHRHADPLVLLKQKHPDSPTRQFAGRSGAGGACSNNDHVEFCFSPMMSRQRKFQTVSIVKARNANYKGPYSFSTWASGWQHAA